MAREPLSITVPWIVNELRRLGYERSAVLVQANARLAQERNEIEQRMRALYEKTVARLHKYEPPRDSTPRTYRAGPMSDG